MIGVGDPNPPGHLKKRALGMFYVDLEHFVKFRDDLKISKFSTFWSPKGACRPLVIRSLVGGGRPPRPLPVVAPETDREGPGNRLFITYRHVLGHFVTFGDDLKISKFSTFWSPKSRPRSHLGSISGLSFDQLLDQKSTNFPTPPIFLCLLQNFSWARILRP